MTASLKVEISKAANVLRVPTVALRYRPSNEVFAALGETPPPVAAAAPDSAPDTTHPSAPAIPPSAATTIDVLFAPMARPDSAGQVWTMTDHQLRRVPIRLGVTDGIWTELLSGDLQAGAELVTNIVVPGGR